MATDKRKTGPGMIILSCSLKHGQQGTSRTSIHFLMKRKHHLHDTLQFQCWDKKIKNHQQRTHFPGLWLAKEGSHAIAILRHGSWVEMVRICSVLCMSFGRPRFQKTWARNPTFWWQNWTLYSCVLSSQHFKHMGKKSNVFVTIRDFLLMSTEPPTLQQTWAKTQNVLLMTVEPPRCQLAWVRRLAAQSPSYTCKLKTPRDGNRQT